MPIQVECHACGSRLRASDSSVGKSLKCPKCSGEVKVPPPLPSKALSTATISAESKPAEGLRKKCPFCAEEIAAEAIKCRYCKSMLPSPQTSTRPTSLPASSLASSFEPAGQSSRGSWLRSPIALIIRDAMGIFGITFLLGFVLGLFATLSGLSVEVILPVIAFVNLVVIAICLTAVGVINRSSRWTHLAAVTVIYWFLGIFPLIFTSTGSFDGWLLSLPLLGLLAIISGALSYLPVLEKFVALLRQKESRA